MQWHRQRKKIGVDKRKVFSITPSRLSESVEDAFFSIFDLFQKVGKAAFSSIIFCNGGHFCKSKHRNSEVQCKQPKLHN